MGVLTFLIHSADGEKLNYFSYDYQKHESSQTRKESIIHLVEQEILFIRECDIHDTVDRTNGIDNTFSPLLEKKLLVPSEEGIFRVQDDLFVEPVLVLFKVFGQVAYTIVCDEDENILLASNFLLLFTRLLHDHFKKNQQGILNEYLTKPEELLALLHKLLPGGHLLFLSNTVSRALRKTAMDQIKS
eukprot:TRINITY_DN1962_c0_g1_i1.p1 TRINITY_DN1962_c0_g1~~TRINITY_DN1962_c0_g1_i1.p1  ORF type:complete len:187 (+),score=38.47 TRINITY_DN1962_c0_g1_i1:12-572(+)